MTTQECRGMLSGSAESMPILRVSYMNVRSILTLSQLSVMTTLIRTTTFEKKNLFAIIGLVKEMRIVQSFRLQHYEKQL